MSRQQPLDHLLQTIQHSSANNRSCLEKTGAASCYFCIRTFSTSEITEWIDSGLTALCPNCSVDAVIPGHISSSVLSAACERWFCKPSNVSIGDITGVSREPNLKEVAERAGSYSSANRSYQCLSNAVLGYDTAPWYRIDLKLRAIRIILKEIRWINRQ